VDDYLTFLEEPLDLDFVMRLQRQSLHRARLRRRLCADRLGATPKAKSGRGACGRNRGGI